MYLKNIIATLSTKVLIMLLSFGLVVLSTNLWGTEGRGHISIIIANMSIIAIFNNLLGGSCISYFTPKIGIEKLLIPAYIWITISSFTGALIFFLLQPEISFLYLFLLTLFLSYQSVHLNIFAAKENFKAFNVLSLLLPALNLLFVLFFEFIVKIKSYESYLAGYLLALFLIWIITIFLTKKYLTDRLSFSIAIIKQALGFGWKIELGNFLQFINYRLSYFLILHYMNMSSVGQYSVGIAVSEAIWLIAKSISVVQYSKIVNNIEHNEGIKLTINSAKLSLYLSTLLAIVILVVPEHTYSLVFGKDFGGVKSILIILLPGIIALSYSNLHGHYFSATGNTRPLIIKTLLGLAFTIVLGPILIMKFGLVGAGVVTSISYTASSIYLVVLFYKKTEFKLSDVTLNVKGIFKLRK